MLSLVVRVLAVVMLIGCSHVELRPLRTRSQIVAECSGGSGNEVRLAHGVDDDAPSLVLTEQHMHGVQPAQPTLAIWSDGRVLFGHSTFGSGAPTSDLLQAEIPRATAQALVEDVAKELATVPRHTEALPYIISGGQLTRITVHIGRRWISASVYDADEGDFLATADGPRVVPTHPPQPASTPESEIDTSGLLLPVEEPAPPPAFSHAYKRIIETRPANGNAFIPDDFDLTFFGPDPYYEKRSPSEMAWPHDLPPAPSTIAPEACSPMTTDGCAFILDTKYGAAARRLQAALHATFPSFFTLHGKRSYVRVDRRYRGERSIAAIATCSDHLVYPKK